MPVHNCHAEILCNVGFSVKGDGRHPPGQYQGQMNQSKINYNTKKWCKKHKEAERFLLVSCGTIKR